VARPADTRTRRETQAGAFVLSRRAGCPDAALVSACVRLPSLRAVPTTERAIDLLAVTGSTVTPGRV
jgi:hypothetical protein